MGQVAQIYKLEESEGGSHSVDRCGISRKSREPAGRAASGVRAA